MDRYMKPLEKDWKLSRARINGWQESYMEKLVKEYMELLNDDLPASSKFWELEKRIKLDKEKPGVLISPSRSQMLYDIIQMINDWAITMDDLSDFSDELRDKVEVFCLCKDSKKM